MSKKKIFQALSLFFLALSFSVQAKVNYLSSAHWCLVDAQGNPPQSCTGPRLNTTHLNDFLAFYHYLDSFKISSSKARRVVPYVAFSTSQMPLGMLDEAKAQYFDYTLYNPVIFNWQAISKVVFFGGSASEGQVLLPTPGWIKAAHRNGSVILGTVFLSPDVFGGALEQNQIKYLLQRDKENRFPVGDLLIAIAQKYHVDGYFINMEASYPQGVTDQDLADFFSYLKLESKNQGTPLLIEWYLVSGSNKDNAFFNQGARNADSVFIDYYQWYNLAIENAIRQGYPLEKIEYGVNGRKQLDHISLPYSASIAEFSYENVLAPDNDHRTSPATQFKNAKQFWSSVPQAFKNPRHRPVSSFLSSNFNAGIGNAFYLEGTAQHHDFWSAIGLQDDLPNAIMHSPLSLDFDVVYSGGSSLQVKSEIPIELALFSALSIPASPNNTLQIVHTKASQGTKICVISFSEKKYCIPLQSAAAIDSKWFKTTLTLPSEVESYHTINIITQQKETMNIGQLYLGPKISSNQKQAPYGLRIVHEVNDKKGKHSVVVWSATNDTKDYILHLDGKFYGLSFQSIADIMVIDKNQIHHLCVQARRVDFQYHSKQCIEI